MEYKDMTIDQLEERRQAILTEAETDGADLDALTEESRAIRAELERRQAEAAKHAEIRENVAAGAGVVIDAFDQHETRGEKTMTINEIRNSAEYMNAFANYIKSGDDRECRAVITENAPEGTTGSGPIPVPEIIEGGVRTAWENDAIMSRVKRTFVRGNLKVAFERSATEAAVHAEGAAAPQEETLTLGVVELVPENIKKWITISDEAMTMSGEAFLRYIYDEITYQIVKKAAAEGIADITGAPAASSATAVGIETISGAPSTTLIPTAAAHLSDEATNVVVIMNRLTEAKFIAAQASGNFAMDPFAGLPRVYTSALKDYDSASANEVYAIVGDLDGLQFNFPEGEGVNIKIDELSLAEQDLVKIVGRQYAGHGVTAPGKFVNIAK